MLKFANIKGINYQIVRIWKTETTREARLLEKKLKKFKNNKKFDTDSSIIYYLPD